ncbi:MAG: PBP1A family penicillin-binding protein [Terriglobales bacterium]
MAIKVKIPKRRPQKGRATSQKFLSDPVVKTAVAVFIVLSLGLFSVFAYYYVKYERIIDRRMNGPIFGTAARIYARPKTVRVGETVSLQELAAELRRGGYSEAGKERESRIGTYRLSGNTLEIRPGPESYHSPEVAIVEVQGGRVSRIVGTGADANSNIAAYELEPQLITALFSSDARAKRQVVHFNEIPKVLVDATLAIEDRRFFEHSGVNYFRLAEAAYVDLRSGGKSQGASTITMQMARAFFLTPEKTLKRKALEMLIAVELEQKFTKQQIFEIYANQVDLGQRGSFTIVGFAEAARAYFNKDLQSITLPEAALLAGIVQRPSYLSPYRHPERAMARRNLVLDSMVETGAITRAQAEQAKATPLKLAPPNVEASDAPYFVDLVKDRVTEQYSERDLNANAYRIYSTLDPDLQRAAAEAVQEGMKLVDAQVTKMRTRKRKVGTGKNAKIETTVKPGPMPQVALVAMDPRTGEVLALVGGRNYGLSQLNHAVQHRPTGSIFKPFVFAAALNVTLGDSGDDPPTAVSTIDDSPTTFTYGDQIYEPRNYKDEYHGQVPLRLALAQSLNNATVKLAEQVGYDNVAALARAAGIRSVKPTPSIALGAYDATPLEMASAYTVFANKGVRLSPLMVRSLRNSQGEVVQDYQATSRLVLDPRVAYVMTSMMQGVINYGTGYDVRRRGFTAPAAGKTGTSHDGWFAGYTTNLLCVVWVGYDDYSDLRLSGAQTAAPIWAEFMKKAIRLPEYRDAGDFPQPAGVVDVQIDKYTNRLSTPACPQAITVAFIAGTEPKETCEQTPDHRNLFQKLLGIGPPPPLPPPQPPVVRHLPPGTPAGMQTAQQQPVQQARPEQKKKGGFFSKIVGIFKDDEQPQTTQKQPPPRQ